MKKEPNKAVVPRRLLVTDCAVGSVGSAKGVLNVAGPLGGVGRGFRRADVHAAGRLSFAEDGPDKASELTGDDDNHFWCDDTSI